MFIQFFIFAFAFVAQSTDTKLEYLNSSFKNTPFRIAEHHKHFGADTLRIENAVLDRRGQIHFVVSWIKRGNVQKVELLKIDLNSQTGEVTIHDERNYWLFGKKTLRSTPLRPNQKEVILTSEVSIPYLVWFQRVSTLQCAASLTDVGRAGSWMD